MRLIWRRRAGRFEKGARVSRTIEIANCPATFYGTVVEVLKNKVRVKTRWSGTLELWDKSKTDLGWD